jgi:hypothetical protein
LGISFGYNSSYGLLGYNAHNGAYKNNFTFNGDHYLQINGSAMGTKMAPSYANTFMGKFEKQLLESSIESPLSWHRFIDDVDMKWTQSDVE